MDAVTSEQFVRAAVQAWFITVVTELESLINYSAALSEDFVRLLLSIQRF